MSRPPRVESAWACPTWWCEGRLHADPARPGTLRCVARPRSRGPTCGLSWRRLPGAEEAATDGCWLLVLAAEGSSVHVPSSRPFRAA